MKTLQFNNDVENTRNGNPIYLASRSEERDMNGSEASLDFDGGPAVSGETVLITGGAGFVGSHLAEALVEDNEVRVLEIGRASCRERV